MRSARRVAVTVLAALAGCDTGQPARPGLGGGPPVEMRDFASGARLRARAWEVDGALVLRDFFDVERGEPCSFADDGSWHVGPGPSYWCLPVGLARHDGGFGPFALFADPVCSRPVAASPVEGPAAYAVVRPADACAAPPSIHRAGDLEVRVPWVYDGMSCQRASLAIAVQPVGEAVPLDAFVRASEQVEDRGSRIAALMAVADDGARMTIGGFDIARNEPVRTEDRHAGTLRWVPARVAFEGAGEVLFGDPSCASTVATKIARDAVCPLTAALVFEDTCGTSRFHELGPPVDRARLKAIDDRGACGPYQGEGVLAYERGPLVPANTLAPAMVSESGGQHVRRRGYAGPGGAIVTWGELVDVATREPCSPAIAHDGSRRCLPAASANVGLFADDACTTPAFERPIVECEQGALARFVQSSGEAGARVFEVTGETSALFEATDGACRRHTSIVPSRGFAVTEVDVTRFALVSERELE